VAAIVMNFKLRFRQWLWLLACHKNRHWSS